ncbi:hypothetical protein Y900_026465 [Mycolicibacterium aromaticivorans JS19b1 = JCM 16368]|uniref:Uncharacterized protein n=1 Tax=Mycolicibacterium aromaticivorans JS19b1 = JCM 16368 TaxID=1440774 RepID=A0A064CRV4_9MYCO|nr:hypothetical protein [Mycolicibacterium aromaticivorans]KDF02382.1 hypothetical protein Y900_026465 [Mycolicibacterium aromaticivorans JS19b1 = JCM 16368]
MGVDVVLVLVVGTPPAAMIGAGVSAADGDALPSGMTIGADLALSPSPLRAESNFGGQSTEVGASTASNLATHTCPSGQLKL